MSHVHKVIIVCGSPGAGKSQYGAELAADRKAVLLDIDTVSERLVMRSLSMLGRDPRDRDSQFFKDNYREAIYETLFDIAHDNVRHSDVIIIGPFTKELRDNHWPQKLTLRLDAKVEIHYVYCEQTERLERIKARGNPRDEAKLANWREHNSYYGDEEPPVFPHILVDTGPKTA